MGRAYVTSGIILNDNSTGTIVDSAGILSTTNFTYDFTEDDDNSVTGTAWASLGTLTFVLTRASLVEINYYFTGTVPASNVLQGGVTVGFAIPQGVLTLTDSIGAAHGYYSGTLSAGTRSSLLQARISSGAGTATGVYCIEHLKVYGR